MNPLIRLPIHFSKHLIKNKWLLKNKVTSSKIEAIVEQARALFPKMVEKNYGKDLKGWGSGFMDAVKKQDIVDELGNLGLTGLPQGKPLGLIEVHRGDLGPKRLLAMARDAVKHRTKKIQLSKTTNMKKRDKIIDSMHKLENKEWNPRQIIEGKPRVIDEGLAKSWEHQGASKIVQKIRKPKRLRKEPEYYLDEGGPIDKVRQKPQAWKDRQKYIMRKPGVPQLIQPSVGEKLHTMANLARPMTQKDLQRTFTSVRERHWFENWRQHWKIKKPTLRDVEDFYNEEYAASTEPMEQWSEDFYKLVKGIPLTRERYLNYMGLKLPPT